MELQITRVMKNLNNISVVITAAGKGSRSELGYSKSLYKIAGETIINRLLKITSDLGLQSNIVVNKNNFDEISKSVTKNNPACHFFIQEKQLGMGNAILSVDQSLMNENILLIWGDLAFLKKSTIELLIKNYYEEKLDFAFPTLISDDAYTMVKRDIKKNIINVLESNEEFKEGFGRAERDIGVILFKRDNVLDMLREELPNKYGQKTNEHGFLYIIEHLVSKKHKVKGMMIAKDIESVSLNTVDDIRVINNIQNDEVT